VIRMTMKLQYTHHARLRLQERGIPERWVPQILQEGERFRDTWTGHQVAVRRRQYQGKDRDIAVVFSQRGDTIVVITVSALKEGQKERRIQAGRWQRA